MPNRTSLSLSLSLSKRAWHISNKYGLDSILKWEIIKRTRNYKVEDKFYLFCIRRKFGNHNVFQF